MAIPVLINIFITGVYVATVVDSLRQARFEDKRLADQQMKHLSKISMLAIKDKQRKIREQGIKTDA